MIELGTTTKGTPTRVMMARNRIAQERASLFVCLFFFQLSCYASCDTTRAKQYPSTSAPSQRLCRLACGNAELNNFIYRTRFRCRRHLFEEDTGKFFFHRFFSLELRETSNSDLLQVKVTEALAKRRNGSRRRS